MAAAVTNNTHGLLKQNLKAFQKRCLSFFIESVFEISMRFPFREIILNKLSFIDPKEVKSRNVVSIGPHGSVFPGILGPDKIDDQDKEWKVLRNTDLADSENNDVEGLWETVREIKRCDETPMFPNLSSFVCGLLCFLIVVPQQKGYFHL